MGEKADLTPGEWKKLIQAPLLAGFALTAADPSGFVGTLARGVFECSFACGSEDKRLRFDEGGRRGNLDFDRPRGSARGHPDDRSGHAVLSLASINAVILNVGGFPRRRTRACSRAGFRNLGNPEERQVLADDQYDKGDCQKGQWI
jgi:hypothetical protein